MAQNKTMLIFIGVLVGVLIAANLLVAVADQEAANTETVIVRNLTVTGPAENASVDLPHRELITRIAVINATNTSTSLGNGAIIETIRSSDDGLLTVSLRFNSSVPATYRSSPVNVSYTANPDGFVSGSSSTLLSTVVLFASIGILLFVIVMIFRKDPAMERIMRLGS